MDIRKQIARSIYLGAGGDPKKQFDTADEIYNQVDKIYSEAGSRVDVEILDVNIEKNGLYVFENENITGYKPVSVEVNVDVGTAYDDGYNAGYSTGVDEGVESQKSKLIDIEITENNVYEREDGYKKVTVDIDLETPYNTGYNNGMKQGYADGYNTGKDDGFTDGMITQKNKLESIKITQNGIYTKEDGWNEVNVETKGDGKLDYTRIGYSDEYNKELNNRIDSDFAYTLEAAKKYSGGTSCYNLYKDDTQLVYGPVLDTSNVTNMQGMFQNCYSLQTIPFLDTSKVTNMYNMFYGCSLQTIPFLDTSKVTNMGYMFDGCTSLTTIPLLDTSKVTSINGMFSDCNSLTTIPLLDTSKVTSMTYVFSNCTSLQSIPLLDTSKVTNMSGMFSSCTSLQSIPLLDTSKVTNISSFIGYSTQTNLTDIGGFKNLGMQKSLSGTDGTAFLSPMSNLTKQSVMNIINNLYDRKSAGYSVVTLKLHANHIAMLSDEEIAIATNKGWTIS